MAGEEANVKAPSSMNFSKLLAFGLDPAAFGMAGMYEVVEKDNQYYLFADDLSAISQDKALKLKLWNALKKMFAMPS